jgi:haloacetate dehalogenase
VWRRADADLMLAYWHWSFLAQPAPLPEKLIGANPSAFFDLHVRSLGLGQVSERYPPDVIETYRALLDDPTVVTAICEDYRAGAGIDRAHDDADRSAGIRIACPVLVLWSARGALPKLYRDVMSVWDPWASDVRGHQIEASHFLVEDEPEQVLQALTPLLRDVRDSPSAPS